MKVSIKRKKTLRQRAEAVLWHVRYFFAKQLLRLVIVINPGERPPDIHPALVASAVSPREPLKINPRFNIDQSEIELIMNDMQTDIQRRHVGSTLDGLEKDLDLSED